jgi:hypothetical protein
MGRSAQQLLQRLTDIERRITEHEGAIKILQAERARIRLHFSHSPRFYRSFKVFIGPVFNIYNLGPSTGGSVPVPMVQYKTGTNGAAEVLRASLTQGSKLDGATHSSTGEQPAGLYRDPVPPSIPQTNRPRATEHREVVGWLNGVHHANTHPNTQKHDPGHSSGRRANTDAAPGQAHSASGGAFGKPQVRPAPKSRPGVHDGDSGALDRGSYGGKYPGAK